MRKPTTVDMRAFNASVKALAGFAGVEQGRAIEYEAGKVIEAAIKFTPVAKAAKIRDTVNKREFLSLDGKRYKLSHRYPDALWRKIQAKQKRGLQRKLKARGLSKQSFLRVGELVGLRVSVPSFVARATSGRPHPENFAARRLRTAGRPGIWFSNAAPTLQSPYVGGRRAVARALQGRKKYFEKNMRLGIFTDLKKIEKAYPGLRITR
jgi:hypothetical protein